MNEVLWAALSDPWTLAAAVGVVGGLGALPWLIWRGRRAAQVEEAILEEEQEVPLPRRPAPAAEPASAKAEATAPPPAGSKRPAPSRFGSGATIPGGISPALVYLQNLKIQIEHFEKEIHQLRSQLAGFATKHDTQFHDLLQRIGELHGELHAQVHEQPPARKPEPSAPQPEPAPAAPIPTEDGGTTKGPAAAEDPLGLEGEPTLEIERPQPPPFQKKPAAKPKAAPARKPIPQPKAPELEVEPQPVVSEPEPEQPSISLSSPAEEAPDQGKDESEDILRPSKGKGPVWPV